jgi:hypothetical protein
VSSPLRTKIKKTDQTGRTKQEPRHVRLYEWFMAAPAWESLPPAAKCVYIEVERRFNGANNGTIGLGVRGAAAAVHISKDTAAKAFKLLIERGFLECATPGGFSTNSCRATEWRLTRAPCDLTKASASKAFMSWRPPPKLIVNRSPKSGTVLSQSEDSGVAKCA